MLLQSVYCFTKFFKCTQPLMTPSCCSTSPEDFFLCFSYRYGVGTDGQTVLGCDGRAWRRVVWMSWRAWKPSEAFRSLRVEALQDANRSSFMGLPLRWVAPEGDGKDKSGQVRHQPDAAEQKLQARRRSEFDFQPLGTKRQAQWRLCWLLH